MPEENSRVTLAILGNKLDTLISKVDKLTARADSDHDEIIAMKSHVDEFIWIKRAVYGLILTALANVGGFIYFVAQNIKSAP